MKRVFAKTTPAFTRIELLLCICIVLLLTLTLGRSIVTSRSRADRVQCFNNMRQIGNAYIQFGLEHYDQMPWRLDSAQGGNHDINPQRHSLWYQYWFVRDALKTPTILMDPAETRANARVATAWDLSETGLQRVKDGAVAYMLGLDALPTNPRSILLTDRNVIDSGSTGFPLSEVRLLATQAQWFDDIHGLVGNVAFADGSIEALNTEQFRAALAQSGRQQVHAMKGAW
ncbi:MAG TPA: hypothetical protein VK615_11520 [Candidatus Binatia bacterium]|nr:hypothetical protein [Candidatus Binatia bacterium]